MEQQEKRYELHMAPMQGYTDWIYRNTFEDHFGGIDAYYTPFVRVEKEGCFRNREIRDIDPANNRVTDLIPQILPGSLKEFRILSGLMKDRGYHRVDINLGCPFPMIAGKKKGAGMLPYPDLVRETLSGIEEFPDIGFSLKIRLGWENVCECIDLLDIINSVRLLHVTVHARTGKQGYKGVTDEEGFRQFYLNSKHLLFYNGDLKTSEEVGRICSEFPLLRGVMIGRGLLASPLMAKEINENVTFSEEERIKRCLAFHQTLFQAYADHLSGENQLLLKMKTLWDYFLPDSDPAFLKKIRKATRISQYQDFSVQAITGRKKI